MSQLKPMRSIQMPRLDSARIPNYAKFWRTYNGVDIYRCYGNEFYMRFEHAGSSLQEFRLRVRSSDEIEFLIDKFLQEHATA